MKQIDDDLLKRTIRELELCDEDVPAITTDLLIYELTEILNS